MKYLTLFLLILPSLVFSDVKNKIIDAAKKGDYNTVQKLVDRSITPVNLNSLNIKNENGKTALHEAVQKGDKKTIEFLVRLGADVNTKSTSGETPLHLAVSYDYKNIVEFLLKHGARVGYQDILGNTPLHLAVFRGNKGVVKLLLKYEAQLDVTNTKGYTPLHQVVDTEASKRVIKFLRKIVEEKNTTKKCQQAFKKTSNWFKSLF